MLFYCPREKQEALRAALGLRTVPVQFDSAGSKVFYVGDSAMG